MAASPGSILRLEASGHKRNPRELHAEILDWFQEGFSGQFEEIWLEMHLKIATAVVSCATALMLVHIIPDLLSVKTREVFLKNKAEELDREMGRIMSQEETGRHVTMLTHEIRSTLDRHTILKTTIVELGRTLNLKECALWMPSQRGLNLQLSHTLNNLIPAGSSVPINLRIVNEVFNSAEAIHIPHTCLLARIRPPVERYVPPEVVAVQVPLLYLSNFQINDWPNLSSKSYAVMVLILPMDGIRKWHDHELELMDVVADQAIDSIKPIASVKKLSLTLILAPDLPVYAVGNEKRLIQTILNIAGNAVKFTKKGYISVVVSIAKPESLRDCRPPSFIPLKILAAVLTPTTPHSFLPNLLSLEEVQTEIMVVLVWDSPFANVYKSNGRVTFGLRVRALDKGTTVTIIVKLGICNSPNEPTMQQFVLAVEQIKGVKISLDINHGQSYA
ncbi:unnamed protein product [Camellia sinensis]